MHELLYLKDEQIKEFIEKLYFAYRESFSDPKKALNNYSLGLAHHKVIHLLSIYDGITISELLKKLKITKQSLNRVLRDLIKTKMIKQIKDDKDTRKKEWQTSLGEVNEEGFQPNDSWWEIALTKRVPVKDK